MTRSEAQRRNVDPLSARPARSSQEQTTLLFIVMSHRPPSISRSSKRDKALFTIFVLERFRLLKYRPLRLFVGFRTPGSHPVTSSLHIRRYSILWSTSPDPSVFWASYLSYPSYIIHRQSNSVPFSLWDLNLLYYITRSSQLLCTFTSELRRPIVQDGIQTIKISQQ
jgi:hypothetical protein